MVFDPSKFKASRISFDFTPYLEHPILEFVKGNKFKPVPSKIAPYNQMYYLVGKDNKFVVTYYEPQNSMQFNALSFEAFQDLVSKGSELESNDPHRCRTELDRLSDLAYVLMSNLDEHEAFFEQYIK